MITKLDDVKIELLRLRADLLPEERVTSKERRRIESARREIKRGRHSSLDEVRKEFGA